MQRYVLFLASANETPKINRFRGIFFAPLFAKKQLVAPPQSAPCGKFSCAVQRIFLRRPPLPSATPSVCLRSLERNNRILILNI